MRKTYKVSRVSQISGKTHVREITMDRDDYYNWVNGMTIQRALPYLSLDDREFLMTGITPEEWQNSVGAS